MKVRIGIDVGGTFTDAAVINHDTYELIGTVKVPTTHTAEDGVASGIVEALQKVMSQYDVKPEDVIFIAHGTTQATNALLEGDVAKVGIITFGSGLQGAKSKSDTTIGNIPLAAGKYLKSENEYISINGTANLMDTIRDTVSKLVQKNASSIVAAEAFSVDDPENENKAILVCTDMDIPATATNDISKLYGLRIRTRTAVVNASVMPKMLEAATMTESSIKKANIKSPLMVMRCDGGVMTVDEVRRRPILTILSGPAAGVAGALMYEKLTDGVFFEVGGTSTDISCVKDGKVMIQYAEVGGHKTYLNSLDVRTVGIGGGSMIQLKKGITIDVGPRSAHIASLSYEVYADENDIIDPKLVTVQPTETDPEYACIECSNGKRFALTLAGAANIAGFIDPEDYAYGNIAAAKKAWQVLADSEKSTVEDMAKKVLAFAAEKNAKVATAIMKDYNMDSRTTLFVGGGGGASTVVPHLAATMKNKYKIAKNSSVISTIGVALAMVRDIVERSVHNPSDEDIISVRREAQEKAIRNGAAPDSVEVSVEIDTQRKVIRAIAVGTTEMRSKNLMTRKLEEQDLLKIASENLNVDVHTLYISARTDAMYAIQYEKEEKKLFGLRRKITTPIRLMDEEGIIRLQRQNAIVHSANIESWKQVVQHIADELSEYNDGGVNFPNIFLVVGKRIVNFSGMQTAEQIYGLGTVELSGYSKDDAVIAIGTSRLDV